MEIQISAEQDIANGQVLQVMTALLLHKRYSSQQRLP